MKEPVFLLAVALFLGGFSITLYARIGETKAEIEERYGQADEYGAFQPFTPLPEGCEQVRYTITNFNITVIFCKGKAVEETFSPQEWRFVAKEECIQLAESIVGTNAWILVSNDIADDGAVFYTGWISEDKQLMLNRVSLAKRTVSLTVRTADFQRLTLEAIAKDISTEGLHTTQHTNLSLTHRQPQSHLQQPNGVPVNSTAKAKRLT